MPQSYSCSPATTPPSQYVNNTGAGSPVLGYPIGFPYLRVDDIVVFTGDTDNWTQRNQGTGTDEYQVNPQTQSATDEVVFNNAVPGTNVLIWRKTDICSLYRQFTAGSSIRAEDLNEDFTQLLYIYQELYTRLFGDKGDGSGSTFWNRISSDVTTPVQGQTIKSGETWKNDDNFIATGAAIEARYQRTMAIGDTPPSNPTIGLMWFNTDCDNSLGIYVWDGSFWVNASTPGKDGVSGGTAIVSKSADVSMVEIGALWYNTTTSMLFCCVKNNAGEKVWAQV